MPEPPRPPPPPWRRLHRGLALAHRQILRLDRAVAELAVAISTPDLARAASDAHYAAADAYADPRRQRAGLFPFEARALAAWFPAPPAKLLVPGAGGGREVLALVERGYDVDGFDPVPALVEAANRALPPQAARVGHQRLEQWAAAPTGPYGGVLTGWGAWSHLLVRDDRLAVLRAFRRACPRGPVLLSFWRREKVFDPDERGAEPPQDPPDPPDRAARFQAFARGVLRARLLGLPAVEPGTVWRAGLYLHSASEPELSGEAGAAGYRLAHYERDGTRFPNAVLVPQ